MKVLIVDDARHPSFVRPTNHIVEVGRKIW